MQIWTHAEIFVQPRRHSRGTESPLLLFEHGKLVFRLLDFVHQNLLQAIVHQRPRLRMCTHLRVSPAPRRTLKAVRAHSLSISDRRVC